MRRIKRRKESMIENGMKRIKSIRENGMKRIKRRKESIIKNGIS